MPAKVDDDSSLPTYTEDQITALARSFRYELDGLLENMAIFSEEGQVTPFEEQFLVLVSSYPVKALQQAVLMTSHENEASFTGRLPIHLACDKSAPIGVIRWLLELDVNKEAILRGDKWGDLPLHTACSRKYPKEVYQMLLENDTEFRTILTRDNAGSIPLHIACRYRAPTEVIMLLLDNDPSRESLFRVDMYGQTPLHVACRNCAPAAVIQLLLLYDREKRSVLLKDNAERIPLHVALLRNNEIESIQLLLEAMICNRMENKGLENWKRMMADFLKSMETYERDFTTRDKLDMVAEALKELRERVILLELAIWRESCLAYHKECKALFEVAPDLKKECRIKSGAQVIIHDVLPFLEDEPIVKLVNEFKNYK